MIKVSDVPTKVTSTFSSPLYNCFKTIVYLDPKPLLPNWKPQPCTLPTIYKEYAESVKNFKVREDDIWIITYPKCGTTWTLETVWFIDNDLDFNKGTAIDLLDRNFFLEYGCVSDKFPIKGLDILNNASGKRLIKTHLPMNLLPNQLWTVNPKIVYVARNPKDVAISYYHHHRKLHGYRGTFEDYLDGFLQNNLIYGSYFQHVDEFIQIDQLKDNILFIRYEDMKFQMPEVLQKLCKFLGKSYSSTELKQLEEHLQFENMRQLPTTNMHKLTELFSELADSKDIPQIFMRKGQVGSFRDELPEKYSKLIDKELEKWNRIQELFKNLNL